MKMNLRSAVQKINQQGMLVVFPVAGKKDPKSLWSEFFPRSKMLWEWDQDGDTRVHDLWHLRAELSSSHQVIYSKWFRGRATLISRQLFVAMHARLSRAPEWSQLTFQARDLLDVLNEDSPLSTKALKRATDLVGRDNEKIYTAGLKLLWTRLMIVAAGEVDDGAFPSLAIAATANLFEDLVAESRKLDSATAQKTIDHYLKPGTAFRKYWDEVEHSFER